MKRCPKCEITKPLEDFQLNRTTKDGRQTYCRACRAMYGISHRSEARRREARYRHSRSEHGRERSRLYLRLYRESHKDKIREIAARGRAKNKKDIAFYDANYYQKNKNRISLRNRQWQKDNPEKMKANKLRRRARERNACGNLTGRHIQLQRGRQLGLCYYCGQPLDNEGRGHIEHKTPLSRGGANCRDNIVIACSTCNLSKGCKTEEEHKARAAAIAARSKP